MTTVLAIDTSTRRIGIAIGTAAGVLGEMAFGGSSESGPPRHVEQLAPAIEYLLNNTETDLGAISAIAVSVGPGMFTGLRVGVVTATMLADALGLPMVGATSLELVARPVLERSTLNVMVVPVLDARRAEVYFGAYDRSDDNDGNGGNGAGARTETENAADASMRMVWEPGIATPAEVCTRLASLAQPVLFCGDGAQRFRDEFAAVDGARFSPVSDASPSVAALVSIGCLRHDRGESVAPDAIAPLYLRQSDAEINATVVAGGRR